MVRLTGPRSWPTVPLTHKFVSSRSTRCSQRRRSDVEGVVMLASAAPAPAWVTHPWVEASAASVCFGIANGPRGDWPALVEFVAALEELGYDAFWSSDHPVPSAGCWTTLAGLAATTT